MLCYKLWHHNLRWWRLKLQQLLTRPYHGYRDTKISMNLPIWPRKTQHFLQGQASNRHGYNLSLHCLGLITISKNYLIILFRYCCQCAFSKALHLTSKLRDIKHCQLFKKSSILGSGGGSVGRAGASDTRDPRFESQHRQSFIYQL